MKRFIFNGGSVITMKKRILCFGDSNTWGYDGSRGERFDDTVRWTGRLQQLLGDEYTVIEEGHNGRTTVWDDPIENRLSGLTYLWPCMDSQSPIDLIIFMLGSNDTKIYFNCTAKSIARGAGRLVDLAQKSCFGRDGKAPEVLLTAPILIRSNPVFGDVFGKQAADKSAEFSLAFKAVAAEYGCHFLDASKIAEPGDADGIHLDEQGHAALAEAFYKKIKEILEFKA